MKITVRSGDSFVEYEEENKPGEGSAGTMRDGYSGTRDPKQLYETIRTMCAEVTKLNNEMYRD